MGFAAGFAAGYEAVDKGIREEEARQKAIEEQKLKLQQIDQSAMQQAGTLSMNTMKELKSSNDSINKAQNLTEYNSAIDMHNNVGANFMNIAQANIESTPTQGVKNIYGSVQFQPKEKATQLSIPDINGNIKEVVLPESFVDQKDSLILMQNGNVGIRNIGEDGKFSNIQPTNVKPIEFKPSKDMFTNGLSLYTPKGDEVKAYSQEEADSFKKQGFDRVKPKEDKGTTVNVMGEDKPIEVADQFGTFYASRDTGQPLLNSDGKKVYKYMNDKTYKIIDGIDQSKQTVAALGNMVKIIDKDPNAIGTIGSDPLNYIANKANDILGIPTPSNVNRNTICGQGGVLAAMTRKLYENGVMTEPDYQRYMKNIPGVDDSDIVFRNKANIMMTDLSNKVKQTESRYSKALPDFVKEDTTSAIAPYEEKKDNISTPKQVGTANGIPVMQDGNGIYIVMPNGEKKYKGSK